MESTEKRSAGYTFLSERYNLDALANWHTSFVSSTGSLRSTFEDGQVTSVYPRSYWPGEGTGDHLEFALKYDGLNPGLLSALFEVLPAEELVVWILSKPTGKYARRIWFLYEFLTAQKLPLPDLDKGNYIGLLEPTRYYALNPGERVQRHRIINNLLGGKDFCPIIRRTEKLAAMEQIDLRKRCEELLAPYPRDLLKRALAYLYNKETKSSFAIENVKSSASRTEKFISLLAMAEHKDFCEKDLLIDLQNRIVDPRFLDTDYRSLQNYIGQSVSWQRQIVHYICPKPADLPQLMSGLIKAHQKMKKGGLPAIIHAAAIAYGFVFLHPFEDGNGRIHRFLIHNILSLSGEVPKGLIFPVSAAMLKNLLLYDHSLEAFSSPLMRLLEYDLDEHGAMTVTKETGRLYRYIDMTAQAEALCDFITLTIEQELVEELDFLAHYDRTKQALQQIVDMPDHLIDHFIQFCLQNNARLSDAKRSSHFEFLTDEEVAAMEKAVREGYAKD